MSTSVNKRLRTLERANYFSKKFDDSETKNITKRRKENLQYEKRPINQYDKSIEEVEDPDFHTASNIATRRKYLRGLEYCKLMDAHLLENSVVQENQRLAFDKYQVSKNTTGLRNGKKRIAGNFIRAPKQNKCSGTSY